MKKEIDELKKWCCDIESFRIGDWSEWPSIDLYMDQVISFLDQYMDYFRIYDDEKMITPSIINNNTKDGVLPKPVKKKYSRSHLSTLLIFCIARQVLSPQELATMLGELAELDNFSEIHSDFSSTLEKELDETCKQIENSTDAFKNNDRRQLAELAMQLTMQSFSTGVAARKILALLEEKDSNQTK